MMFSATSNGPRFTQILEDYYTKDPYIKHRISTYCAAVGLKDWDGEKFGNEAAWMKYYCKQLRDNTSFQVYSLTNEKLRSIWLPIRVWFNGFRKVLLLETLLEIYLVALKALIRQEPKR